MKYSKKDILVREKEILKWVDKELEKTKTEKEISSIREKIKTLLTKNRIEEFSCKD